MIDKPENFTLLPHTADLYVRVNGDTLTDLFKAGAQSLAYMLYPENANFAGSHRRDIELHNPDPALLFRSWLGEILFLFTTEKLLFIGLDDLHITNGYLKSVITTAIVDEVHLAGFQEIKSITYHNLELNLKLGYATYIADI